MELYKLNFGENYNFKFKKIKEIFYIYDIIRNKFIVLTSEEWVRQHWIHYFVYSNKNIKSSLVIEKEIELSGLIKRIDILVNKKSKPYILVECKAPNIALDEKVLQQCMRYNSVIKTEILILSNGLQHKIYTYNLIKNTYSLKNYF